MTAVLTADEAPQPSQAADRWPHVPLTSRQRSYGLAVVWLVCAFPFSVNVVDPDLWGHVQYAQDWIAEGALPRVSSHNFTALGYRWINHENLSELALAIGFDRLGNTGMALVKLFSGIALLLVAWRSARRQQVGIGVFLTIAIFFAYAVHPFWLFRPQMATWLALASMVWLLDAAFAGWGKAFETRASDAPVVSPDVATIRWSYLVALCPLFFVWTNAHGGFLAGLCIVWVYLFGRSVETILYNRSNARHTVFALALVGLGVGVTTLLNPYGIALHRWLIESLGEARPEIMEWHSPSILSPVFAPFFGLVLLSLVSWLGSDRRRDWTHGLLLFIVMLQSLAHIRHIALFSILALFWLPEHVSSLKEKCLADGATRLWFSLSNRVVSCGCLVVMLVASWMTVQRLTSLPVASDRYPVQALQFMRDHSMDGRLVVSFNWAQYAIAALQPGTKVSFDGRFRTCYPQHIIDKHFDLMVGDVEHSRNRASAVSFDATAILREGDPDLVLLDRQFPHAIQVMAEQTDDFTLLYEDSVSQLWGRRHRFADARTVHGKDDYPDVEWPAIPEPSSRPALQVADQSESLGSAKN